MSKRHLLLAILLLYPFLFFGQSDKVKEKIVALFSKSQQVYEDNNAFKLNISYQLYPNYKTSKASEQYNGIILKKNKDFYSKIHLTEFLNLSGQYLKIDNEEKLIQVSKDTDNKVDQVYNLTNLVANFKTFEIISEGNYWVCTMTAPAITFVPYSKARIYINKKDHTIHKQVLYYLTKNKYKGSKGELLSDYPRLEIVLSNFETIGLDMDSRFKLDNYIIISGPSKPIPSKSYKGYKIVD